MIEFTNEPISEGMQYGPFPPPELDSEPVAAGWLMEEAKGDLALYQLYRLHERLKTDRAEHQVTSVVFSLNDNRLRTEIKRVKNKLIRDDMRRVKSERVWLIDDDL